MNVSRSYDKMGKFFDRHSETLDWSVVFTLIFAIVLGHFLSGCGDEEGGYQRRPHHDSPDPTGGSSGNYYPPDSDPPDQDDDPDEDVVCQDVPDNLEFFAYGCNNPYGQYINPDLIVGVHFNGQPKAHVIDGYDLNNGSYSLGLKTVYEDCGPLKMVVVTNGMPEMNFSEPVEIWSFQKEAVEIAFAHIQNYEVQDPTTWFTADMVYLLHEIFSCQVEGHCEYNYSMPSDTVTMVDVSSAAESGHCGLGIYLIRSRPN